MHNKCNCIDSYIYTKPHDSTTFEGALTLYEKMVRKSTKQDVVNRRDKGKMVFERTKVYASTQSKSNDSGYKRVKAKTDLEKI